MWTAPDQIFHPVIRFPPPVFLSFCHSVILSSCHPVILSSCHPVILPFCYPATLSSYHFIILLSAVILSSCDHLILSSGKPSSSLSSCWQMWPTPDHIFHPLPSTSLLNLASHHKKSGPGKFYLRKFTISSSGKRFPASNADWHHGWDFGPGAPPLSHLNLVPRQKFPKQSKYFGSRLSRFAKYIFICYNFEPNLLLWGAFCQDSWKQRCSKLKDKQCHQKQYLSTKLYSSKYFSINAL